MNAKTTTLGLLVATVVALSLSLPGQIPSNWVLVDDMYLPPADPNEDAAFTATPWPTVVPFVVDANVSAANQQVLQACFAEIEAVCSVRFLPRSVQNDYVVFKSAAVNNSAVGMVGGAQDLNITSWGFPFIIVHEILHALGHVHEHQRPDRGAFVTPQLNNVAATCGTSLSQSCLDNFQIQAGAQTVGPYDFLSVMHYSEFTFSANGLPTLICQPTFAAFQTTMGQRSFLSLGDAQALKDRYGSGGVVPEIFSVSPTSAAPGPGAFPITVTGSGFSRGTLIPGSGVPGTRVLWNGVPLPTLFASRTQLVATVPAILQAGTVTVQIENPSPGSGVSFSATTFSVGCTGAGLGLGANTVSSASTPCTPFGITPIGAAWNVVAVTSPTSDWNISIGTAASNRGSGLTDIVAASGFHPGAASEITPTSGSIERISGGLPATVEFVASTPLSAAGTTLSSIPPGSMLRAFSLPIFGQASRRIEVSGSANLRWTLIHDHGLAGFEWRDIVADAYTSGVVGGPPVDIVLLPVVYCLVVYRDGGVATANESFTVDVCFGAPSIVLGAGTTVLDPNQGFCQPLAIAPTFDRWNAVGVTSTSDYDVRMGNTASQLGGSQCDYVIANGHFQQSAATTGLASRYSGFDLGHATHATGTPVTSFPGTAGATAEMLHVFEFFPLVQGNYDLSITATAPGFTWDLHQPGVDGGWRRRSDAAFGGHAADGSAVRLQLDSGWYSLVVHRAGGALLGAPASLGFTATTSTVQPPSLTGISPGSAPALSGPLALIATGSSFSPNSVVLWNGAPVPTAFVSSTELTATIDAPLLAAPGSALLTVLDPAGVSGPQVFFIGNPVPVLTSLSPIKVVAGAPGFNLTVQGIGFAPGAIVTFGTTSVATTFVNSTELVAAVPPSLIELVGAEPVSAYNSFSGASNALYIGIFGPLIAYVTPSAIPVSVHGPVTLTLLGQDILQSAVVYADGVPLPTTWLSDAQLEAELDPALFPQTGVEGGIAMTVANTSLAKSNSLALVVGSGSNRGTIRLDPLAPAPGSPFSIVFEEDQGVAGVPITLFADFGTPVPVPQYPNPAIGLVLGVIAGSPGPWVAIVDGLGVLGPPDGTQLSFVNYGGWLSVGPYPMPAFPVGLTLKLQALYVDPSAPLQVNLSWTRTMEL